MEVCIYCWIDFLGFEVSAIEHSQFFLVINFEEEDHSLDGYFVSVDVVHVLKGLL